MKVTVTDKGTTSFKKHVVLKDNNIFNRTGMLFANLAVVIALVHFAIFYVFMNAQIFILAFNSKPDGTGTFTLEHFQRLFNELRQTDTVLKIAFINTFKYFGLGILKLCLGYLIAYFFFKKVYGAKIYSFIFFLPSMVSSTVMVTMFKDVISPTGAISKFFYSIGWGEIPPLTQNAATATPTILFYTLWSGFGIQFLIFIGTMNRIPQSLFDVGKLDGLPWQRELVQVILPLTWETFLIYLLQSFTTIFTATGPILYFTGVGNYFLNTYTISFYIFDQTSTGILNYPSAIGLFFSVCTVPIVILVRLLLRKVNQEITY